MHNVLEIDGIQFQFNEKKILSAIHIKCETNQVTGLLGKNGQGKSCLMNIIYGTLSCEKSVRFNNVSIFEGFSRPDLLMYLPQFNFIPKFLRLHRVFKHFSIDYHEFQVSFPEFSYRGKFTIGSLSGGERRLVELYVILKSPAQFFLLDEPFTHLNPIQIDKVKALIVTEKKNKGLLITDHMFQHVVGLSDRLYVLTNGQTYLTKSVQDIEMMGYARL
jgi:ABC-type lipopolysaccharide export system ATPase subunit